MSNFDFQDLVGEIRRLLKERKKTYRDLAKFLKISESSVKKQFISADCSLSRLNLICQFLEMEINDLLVARKVQPKTMNFTEAQEKFLVENEKHLHVYWKLVYEEWTPEEIKKEFGISEAVMFKYLRELDRHKLLELLPDGKVRHPEMKMVFWRNKGELINIVKNKWSIDMIRKVNEEKGPGINHLAVRLYMLRAETQQEFVKATEDVFMEFAHRSLREARLYKNEVLPFAVVAGFAPRSFVEKI